MNSGLLKKNPIVLLLCILAGTVVYANSLDVPFYLDDFRNILENSSIHLTDLSLSGLRDTVAGGTLKTRPVANISFALNYYFHQENVAGYHVVNVIIHILTGFFLYQLALITLSTPALRQRYQNRNTIALLAALLWLVHPLHTQSVTYIVQRMNSMAVMFYVLAFWLYVRGRMECMAKRWLLYGAALVAAMLAIGSKEIAATLPFFILLYEWYFFQDLDRHWLVRKVWLIVVPVLFVILLMLIYVDNPVNLLSGYEGRPFTLIERLLTQSRVVLLYAGLLIFPYPGFLNIDHQIALSYSPVEPVSTLIALALVTGLLVLSLVFARKQRLLSFALLWYFGNLAIESTVLPLELVFEHRAYLPSVFVIITLTAILYQWCRPKWCATALLVAAIVICSFWTIQRNNTWRDPVTFWEDSAAKSADKARPFINLSAAYRENGALDKAVRAAETAIRVDPRFVNGFVALGTAYLAKGEYDLAIASYREALQRMPDYAGVYNSLAKAYLSKGMTREAVAALQENLRLDPRSYEALVNLASIKASRGMIREAIVDFQRALEVRGGDPDILFNLAIAYTQAGQAAQAVRVYQQILAVNPKDREAAENLQKLLPYTDGPDP